MKKYILIFIISILTLFSLVAHSQVVHTTNTPQTSYIVDSISNLETYYGNASRLYILSTGETFVNCYDCVVDSEQIFQGVGGRKWKLEGTLFGTENDITVRLDNSRRTIIGRLQPNGYTGIITWSGTGLIFNASNLSITLDNRTWAFRDTTLTLSTADPTYSRYDVFGIDTLGAFVKQGIPAPSPVIPTVGVDSFAITSGFLINPGDTVPSNIVTSIVYDQHIGGEWTPGAQHGNYVVDFDNTANPFHLTKAAFLSKFQNTSLFFIDGSEHPSNVSGTIDFWLYLNGNYTGSLYLLLFDNSISAANSYLLTSANGFNKNDSNHYFHVVIPYSSITWLKQQFNQLQLLFNGVDTSGAKGLYVDWIRLQSGIPNIPAKTYQDSTGLIKTTVGGDTLNTVIWYANGIVHSLPPIYTKTPNLNQVAHVGAYSDIDIYPDSVRVGKGAGNISSNTVVGANALSSNTTGNSNTAIGDSAMYATTTSAGNTAIGYGALRTSISSIANTAIGYEALQLSTGSTNVAVGYTSLMVNTTGSSNVAVGSTTLSKNTTGTANTAIGNAALRNNTTGTANTAIGSNALLSNKTGISNTMLGSNSGNALLSGSFNTAFGNQSFSSDTSGNNNISIGNQSMVKSTKSSYNISIGDSSLLNATTYSHMIVIGKASGLNTTTASYNILIGDSAYINDSTATRSIAIGKKAGSNISSAIDAVAIGTNAIAASNQFALSDSITKMYFKNIDSAAGTAPNIVSKDGAGNWHVYANSGGGGSVNFAINERFTGSTSSTLTTAHNYTSGTIEIWKNGAKLDPTTDYSQATANTITLIVPRLSGDVFLTDYHY